MRITSEIFKLPAGFEADGLRITGCSVRLLTYTERQAIERSAQQQLAASYDQVKSGVAEYDMFRTMNELEQARQDRRFIEQVAAFYAADPGDAESFSTRVDDRNKIEQYRGLLLEPDEEIIRGEQGALFERYSRPKRTMDCPQCGAQIEVS